MFTGFAYPEANWYRIHIIHFTSLRRKKMRAQFSNIDLQLSSTVFQDDKAVYLTIYTGGSQC